MNPSIEPKRKLEINESWELPWVCWGLIKEKYSQALAISCVLVAIYFPFVLIPFIGNAIGTFILTIAVYGTVKICRTWDQGGDAKISDLFVGITDPKQRERLLPLAGALAALTLVSTLLAVGIGVIAKGSLWASAMSFPITLGFALLQSALNYFSISLLAFHQNIQWQEALRISFDTYVANIIPLVFVGLVLMVIAIVSAVCLILPVFFFFIPMSLPALYFLYKAVFEGLVLKSAD